MGVLNIALVGSALARTQVRGQTDIAIIRAKTMKGVRELCKDDEDHKKEVIRSMSTPLETLRRQFKRMSFSNSPIEATVPCEEVNPLIVELKKVADTLDDAFMKAHCILRRYFFAFKKCESIGCKCRMVKVPFSVFSRLKFPDPTIDPEQKDHYMPFAKAYELAETKEVLPAPEKKAAASSDHLRYIGALVVEYIRCTECNKPRCVYSATTPPDEAWKNWEARELNFTCGADLNHAKFYTKKLKCEDNIETAFYGKIAKRLKFPKVCSVCGAGGPLATPEGAHYICQLCVAQKKKPVNKKSNKRKNPSQDA